MTGESRLRKLPTRVVSATASHHVSKRSILGSGDKENLSKVSYIASR
jgi:hypothetical protein